MAPSSNNGSFGQRSPTSSATDSTAVKFAVAQLLNRIETTTLVKVISVTNTGGLSPVGFVDVQPLVNQMTGDRKPVVMPIIHNIPYFRLQGGSDAIILDPKVGDIGSCGFCSRDISAIKTTKAQGNPISFRKFSLADGLYWGGFLNDTPTQFIQFNDSGITITSPNAVTINAPTVTVNATTANIVATTLNITATTIRSVGQWLHMSAMSVLGLFSANGGLSAQAGTGGGSAATISGSLTATGEVTASGKNLSTHTHGGVQSGSSNTAPPT